MNLTVTRDNFLVNVKQKFPIFEKFNLQNIIQYCLHLHDARIIPEMTEYIKTISTIYKEERNAKKKEEPITTRCGRLIKKPDKLDL